MFYHLYLRTSPLVASKYYFPHNKCILAVVFEIKSEINNIGCTTPSIDTEKYGLH